MSGFFALMRKHFLESRWTLGFSSLALFGLSYLSVVVTSLNEARVRKDFAAGKGGGLRRMAFRELSASAGELPSVAIELIWWSHPFVLTAFLLWAIARGSIAVAGEIERGTLDMVVSRPVSRAGYLGSQVVVAALGLGLLCAALVAGNLWGNRYYKVETPATALVLARPALELFGLGLAVYGPTLFMSVLDNVRWRPNLIASVLTLASFILLVIANVPVLENWKWVGSLSIFKAYSPVEAAVEGKHLAFNAGILSGIGAAFLASAFLAFQYRDLPANS